jgi:hypothetical protein
VEILPSPKWRFCHLQGALELGDGDIVPTMQNELGITAGAESHVAEAGSMEGLKHALSMPESL